MAAGDSFTFGGQVSNNQTWPSCLERTLKMGVANAGAFGYGAAQSLLRVKKEIGLREYSILILSVLVNDDFDRDRYIFRKGFPRPAVIIKSDNVDWASVPPNDPIETKYGEHEIQLLDSILRYLFKHSQIIGGILGRMPIDLSGDTYTKIHPLAADQIEIVRFELEQFAELSASQKYFVLQYTSGDLVGLDRHTDRIRNAITGMSSSLDFVLVDTYVLLQEALKEYPTTEIWDGHHTQFGNELVCGMIASVLKQNLNWQ